MARFERYLPFIFSFLTKLWHQSVWTISDANSSRKVFLFWNLSHFSGDEPKMYNGAAAYLISTLGHASFAVIPVRLHCVVNLYVSAFVIFQLLMIVMPPPIQTGRRHIFYLIVHPSINKFVNNIIWKEWTDFGTRQTDESGVDDFLVLSSPVCKTSIQKPSLLNKQHIFCRPHEIRRRQALRVDIFFLLRKVGHFRVILRWYLSFENYRKQIACVCDFVTCSRSATLRVDILLKHAQFSTESCHVNYYIKLTSAELVHQSNNSVIIAIK